MIPLAAEFPRVSILRFFALPAIAAAIALLCAGCGASDTRYYAGTFSQNQELRELFQMLQREKDQEDRFVLIQQIAAALANAGKRDKEILFLTTHVERNPADIFNGYYLLLVADAYRDLKAPPFATHYYRRILQNNADLLVLGRSIHLHCLQELISLETNPEYRIEYYKELISRFGDQVEHPGSSWYFMAKSYEEVGEWEQAVQSYQKYLNSQDTEIPGDSNAYRKAAEKVALYYAQDKSWTFPELSILVDAVKDAILSKSLAKLRKLQAKVNFFQEGWDQQSPVDNETPDFTIASYLGSSNAKIDGELDIASNDREAYLRTTNWNFRPPTWYLYFRKVDFPANPDINGQWEWAGIYFGEKL
jgi:tetratricopeptide (TPR) repeat protein